MNDYEVLSDTVCDWNTMEHCEGLCRTARHNDTPWHTDRTLWVIVKPCVALCGTVWHSVTLSGTTYVRPFQALLGTVRHCVALSDTAKHCQALSGTARHCHALPWIFWQCVGLWGTVRHCQTWKLQKWSYLNQPLFSHQCISISEKILLPLCVSTV